MGGIAELAVEVIRHLRGAFQGQIKVIIERRIISCLAHHNELCRIKPMGDSGSLHQYIPNKLWTGWGYLRRSIETPCGIIDFLKLVWPSHHGRKIISRSLKIEKVIDWILTLVVRSSLRDGESRWVFSSNVAPFEIRAHRQIRIHADERRQFNPRGGIVVSGNKQEKWVTGFFFFRTKRVTYEPTET